MDTQSIGRTDLGRRRKNNEDYIAYFEPTDSVELKTYGSLYIVADGVGGAAHGERASQHAAKKVLFDYYKPYKPDPNSPEQLILLEPLGRLSKILRQANEEIYQYASQNDMRMATTFVAAVIRSGILYVANVGDSRVYLIRNGVARQINRDHSIVGEMVEHNEMTEAEAMASSIKNRLTRSLGGDPDVSVDISYEPEHLQSGDKILLCTDGLTRYASKEDVVKMTIGTSLESAERLIKFANDKGGADNVSVIVISYQPDGFGPSGYLVRPPNPEDLATMKPGSFDPTPDSVSKYANPTNNKPVKAMKEDKKFSLIMALTLLVLLLGVTVVLGAATYFYYSTKTAPVPPTSTNIPMIVSPIATIATTATTTFSDETPMPTSTATQILPTSIFSPQPISNSDSWCVSKVEDGDSLFGILSKFEQKYDEDESAQYYRCESIDDNTKCEETVIEDNKNIKPGWRVIIRGVDEEFCIAHEGQWAPKQ